MPDARIVAQPAAAASPRPPVSGRRARPFYQSTAFAQALRVGGVSRPARLYLQEIERRCGGRTFTWVRQDEIAQAEGVSVRTIRRWEAELARAGFLTIDRMSLWARHRRGGVRRVLVPHVRQGDAFGCPDGALEEARKRLLGRRSRPSHRRVTRRARMSDTTARALLSRKRKGAATPLDSTRGTKPGTLDWVKAKAGPDWELALDGLAQLRSTCRDLRDNGRVILDRWGIHVPQLGGIFSSEELAHALS